MHAHTLIKTLALAVVLTLGAPNLSIADDCGFVCSGGGSGDCGGFSGSFKVNCSGSECTVTKTLGNGIAYKRTSEPVSSSSHDQVCVSVGGCEVCAQPCYGSDWGDASGDCGELCIECAQ